MAYSTGDTILDTHYNGFVTSVNAMWGQGTGARGLGQATTVSTVSDGDTITAAQWATLLTRIKSISDHGAEDGNISVDSVTNPSTGDLITALNTLATDIGTLDTDQAGGTTGATVGSATTTTLTSTGTFTTTISHEASLTFQGGDEARHYFNGGGYIDINPGLAGGTADGKYNEWLDLIDTLIGSVRIRATTLEKNGGSGTPATNASTTGYYDLGTGYTVLYKQVADTAPYTANYWQMEAKVSAAHADSRGNNGEVITIKCTWQDDAADSTSYNKNIYNVLDQVNGNKSDLFSAHPPATTYVTATWGTLTWATVANTES